MKVRRYDYPAQFGDDVAELIDDIGKMILNGKYILTHEVEEFEAKFAKYLNVEFARGVNSGTDALLLALHALGIGKGDEVITPANTFHATVAAICHSGATPVLVDADPETFLIDCSRIEAAITSKTKVILPVHLYGKPCDMGTIMTLAQKHNLLVVEDAAQAHGARIGGQRVGTFGDFGCFSFHPSKNLAAAGDGGAVVTGNAALANEISQRRSLGQRSQNEHVFVGLNSKLDAIQARILDHKLPKLDLWNESRRSIAGAYRQALDGQPVYLQRLDDGEEHVFHLFQAGTERRDELLEFLRSKDVDATIRYPDPIHLQESFSSFDWKRGQFPVAEKLTSQLLCLPIRPNMPLEEVDYVADQIKRFFSE